MRKCCNLSILAKFTPIFPPSAPTNFFFGISAPHHGWRVRNKIALIRSPCFSISPMHFRMRALSLCMNKNRLHDFVLVVAQLLFSAQTKLVCSLDKNQNYAPLKGKPASIQPLTANSHLCFLWYFILLSFYHTFMGLSCLNATLFELANGVTWRRVPKIIKLLYFQTGLPDRPWRDATKSAANLSEIWQILWCRWYCGTLLVCLPHSSNWNRWKICNKLIESHLFSSTRYSRSDCDEGDSRFSFSNSNSPLLQVK